MDNAALLKDLREIVGKKYVITGERSTERFRIGFRSGKGGALCVVRPGKLLELWKVLQTCVAADKIVILQAANTGLTEGSTPKDAYDRDVVIINTLRMDQIALLHEGAEVVSFPGATLFSLERLLAPLGRDPHSVIGSSSIGATVVGGVCNNSGGSLVERGPAYTELSMFARVGADGQLDLVNHLGIDLGDTPEEMLTRLENGDYDKTPSKGNKKASASDYVDVVRQVDADTPSRYNADKRMLFESAGSAGKLVVFAVRLDTFEKPPETKTFYIGTNEVDDLTELRRHILTKFKNLPISAEYMERDLFNVSERYGKDTVMMIDWLGTDRLPMFFALKGKVDSWLRPLGPLANLTDRFMQFVSWITPGVLPKKMLEYRDRFQHHLILKMRDGGIAEAEVFLPEHFAGREAEFFACDAREAKLAGLHRFAAAGAAVRYMAVHRSEVEDILALDIALRRNDRDWVEKLPKEITDKLVHSLYYGHFMCHVMHQDYIVKKGHDPKEVKAAMLKILDERGAEYPSEHNVGHIYEAKPDLAAHYKDCDPTNSFNPGIGKMSRDKHYGASDV
ncbi:D-lactate dehydrogenase [Cognatishimia activa]|uniref:Quinone-dependent D-lactate dehydrogenase n=1 Tax=Cognatishimia activa TaxID=1715691 RepID=A0A0N7MBN7_9RHOB|nr:D-lactate dehydrogenase [Cognatishimia activa]CUI98201.1 D-lactate dehydrogenase [Cognatishimia activa]CUK25920.1 D-lactate dehydrogenase [Cognatishimia activa]